MRFLPPPIVIFRANVKLVRTDFFLVVYRQTRLRELKMLSEIQLNIIIRLPHGTKENSVALSSESFPHSLSLAAAFSLTRAFPLSFSLAIFSRWQ